MPVQHPLLPLGSLLRGPWAPRCCCWLVWRLLCQESECEGAIFSLCYPLNYLVSVWPSCLVLPENVSLSFPTQGKPGEEDPMEPPLCSHRRGALLVHRTKARRASQDVLAPPSQRGLGTGGRRAVQAGPLTCLHSPRVRAWLGGH